MISKKKIFWFSLFLIVVSIIIDPYLIGLCTDSYKYCFSGEIAHSLEKPLFIISLPIFLLSLITYKMRDLVYQAWFRFVRWWVPLTVALVLLAPSYGHGLVPIDKGRVSLFLSSIFFLVSIIIILVKRTVDTNK